MSSILEMTLYQLSFWLEFKELVILFRRMGQQIILRSWKNHRPCLVNGSICYSKRVWLLWWHTHPWHSCVQWTYQWYIVENKVVILENICTSLQLSELCHISVRETRMGFSFSGRVLITLFRHCFRRSKGKSSIYFSRVAEDILLNKSLKLFHILFY